MILQMLRRLGASRRSAVAVIMAISLVPLMLLVGIAVDFTFLYQSRTQTAFASQAASTQALRIAAATYALEVANGSSSTVAVQHAIAAANTSGNLWFDANLGNLTRATLTSRSTNTTYDGNTNGVTNPNVPPNFTAAVTDTATYPPIFNPLFGSTKNWSYSSNATGTTSYAYAQILFMLDTSNSMLIGARQQDIQTMEQNSVCIPSKTVVPDIFDGQTLSYQNGNNFDYNFGPGDSTWIGFLPSDAPNNVLYYDATKATGTEPSPTKSPSGTAPYQLNGKCNSGYSGPYEPCALACHSQTSSFSSTTAAVPGTYSADLYGLARSEGVELRVDVLLSATEKAIKDMISAQAVANQLTAGVYQFNTDIAPIVRGTTSTGDALPEATSNLSAALTAVQAVDYNQNHSETSIPVLVSDCTTYNFPKQENCAGNTNLVQSMQHLIAGKLPTDSNAQALTQAGDGSTAGKPLKFMFLVTDGMEGESAGDGAADLATNPAYAGKGVMTTLNDNAAVSDATLSPGTCTSLKKLGYTVYVLYVDYLPVAESQYYIEPDALSTQTKTSFPGVSHLVDVADPAPYISAGGTASQITANIAAHVPTAEALAQCASSPSDFYSANSDTDIQTSLSSMLKSALSSTIRLTN